MTGGDYHSWFEISDAELRKVLYSLEDLGITRADQIKQGTGWYSYNWQLTDKAKALIEKDKSLQDLWDSGMVIQFHDRIKDLI